MFSGVELSSAFFVIFFVLVLVFFIRQFFTKAGRLSTIKFVSGAKEVTLLGEISPVELKSRLGIGSKQKLNLYRCMGDIKEFYVLEVTQNMFGSMKRVFVKLDPQTLKEIDQLVKKQI